MRRPDRWEHCVLVHRFLPHKPPSHFTAPFRIEWSFRLFSLVSMYRTTNMTHTQSNLSPAITPHAAARYWRATRARDPRADGTFFLAVRSTHIYCRPSCPARRPLRRNVTFFRTREEAERQGYRPCLRCRPNEISGPVALVQRAADLLAQSTEESLSLHQLAQ